MRVRLALITVTAFLGFACANPSEPEDDRDAGRRDTGVRDAGAAPPRDGGPRDGGGIDAGARDAGPRDGGDARDGGVEDDGFRDGGVVDAGARDGGERDGGFIDAGARDGGPRDGGPRDGGPRDGGPRDGGPRDGGPIDSGCVTPALVGTASGYTGPAPVAYYTFDAIHRAGNDVIDVVGTPYDATPNAAALAALGGAGAVGEAAAFDGATALINADPPKTNTFSGAMWVRPTAWPTGQRTVIMNLGNGPGAWQGWGFSMRTNGQIVGFVEGGGSIANEHVAPTASCVEPGAWVHVAVTFDGSALRLYENGVLQSTTPTNLSTVAFGSVGLVLGYHSYFQNAYFDGDVDELAIWDVPLDAADIAEIYFAGRDGTYFVCPELCGDPAPAAGSNVPTNGLVAWYRSDVGPQTDAAGLMCSWCDQSAARQDLFQSDATRRPTTTTGVTNAPTVRFDLNDVFFESGDMTIPATAGRTYVIVFRNHALAPRVSPVRQGRFGTPGTYLQIEANTFMTSGQRYGVYVTNNSYDSTTVTTTAAPHLHVMEMNSMTVGLQILSEVSYWIDGTLQSLTRNPGGLGNNTIQSFAADFFSVGASGTGGVDIHEVLIYDRPLTIAERAAIQAELTTRHGL